MSRSKVKKSAILTALLLIACFAFLFGLIACSSAKPQTPDPDPDTDPQPDNCIVVFYEAEGSSVPSQTVPRGGKVTRPAEPVKENAIFGGWFTNPAYTEEWDFAADTVDEEVIILFAKWIPATGTPDPDPDPTPDPDPNPPAPVTYAVLFYTGSQEVTVPSQTITAGGKVTRPSEISIPGKRFIGWYKDSAKTVPWNFDTDTVSGPTVIYAKWEDVNDPNPDPDPPQTYTVTFNTGVQSVTVPSQTITAGGKVTRPTDPVLSGKRFAGWYKNSTRTVLWNFDTDTVSGPTVIYAKWEDVNDPNPDPQTYTVIFNTGVQSVTVPSQTITAGGKVTRPPDPVLSGKRFAGWYKNSTRTVLWNFDTDTVSGPTVIYAKWEDANTPDPEPDPSQTFTVTFNVGLDARKRGLSNPPATTVAKGGKVTAPSVSLDGYTLDGWYVEGGDTKWDFYRNTVNSTMTLFAKWESGGGDRVEYTPSMRENNTLYIHYLRQDGYYSGWSAWVWMTGANGRRYVYNDVDDAGAAIAVDLGSYGMPTAVNFKIAVISDSGVWGEEDGGDCSIVLANTLRVGNSYHWFIHSGDTANGKAYLSFAPISSSQTEPLRASVSDVNRSYAANLPKAATVTGWDEVGVGYQIFVASFCDSNGDGVGDIRGIINKLNYFDSLNIDVLWLTPIQSSNSYHGYDCYDYYSIDPKFGTNADYRELVFKAHQKGIKVIMDLVVNHTSPQNEWFIKSKQGVVETVTYQDGTTAEVRYRDFYRWSNSGGSRKYSTGDGWYFYSSFGSNMPELNYDCQAVRNAMGDVAAYWMNYGLDGFRMDAIKHVFMNDESVNASSDRIVGDTGWQYNLDKNTEFFKEFNYKLKSKYPHCFLLGEQLDGNADNVAPFYAGMDSLFDFNTYYNLPGNISRGNADAVAYALNANAGKYEQHRGDRPINSMISSNHDIPRLSSALDTQKSKLYFAVMMTMPGLSWIYYGDEIGMIGPGGDGDANYRQSMKWTEDWDNECHNDISAKDLNLYIDSVDTQSSDSTSLLNYVKSLAYIRDSNPVLINGSATCSVDNGLLKISVRNSQTSLTVYHNLTGSTKHVNGTVIFGLNDVGPYSTAIVR